MDARVLMRMLQTSSYGTFRVSHAATFREGTALLARRNDVDVVLLDLNLGDSRGMDTLEEVHRRWPHLPLLVNTGAYEDDVGLEAITRGAQDYLVKGRYKSYALSKALYYAVERMRTARELQEAYHRLKETQAQLIQAEKMAGVGGVASGIAHEVRNPLATILYGIEFLKMKMGEADAQVELTLATMHKAATNANTIIQDLLDFAALSDLKKAETDLEDLIQGALLLTRPLCEKRRVVVMLRLDPGLPRVSVDRNRIEQVLVDVILNAVHAMPDGGVLTLENSLYPAIPPEMEGTACSGVQPSPTGPFVVLDVLDTGRGVSSDDLPKVFDPFFTTRRGDGGVGLGLAVARTILRNHGGSIDLKNREDGPGARVRIVLPVVERARQRRATKGGLHGAEEDARPHRG